MLGPLNMGHLTHIPWHGALAGSDHYLVAYAVDGGRAWLQDPAGFPSCRCRDISETGRAS